MAGAPVAVPAETASATVAAIAPTPAAAAAARAVGVGGLGRQIFVGVLRGVGQRTCSDADAWACLGASQRASTTKVSSCVKKETGPVLLLASRIPIAAVPAAEIALPMLQPLPRLPRVPKCISLLTAPCSGHYLPGRHRSSRLSPRRIGPQPPREGPPSRRRAGRPGISGPPQQGRPQPP